jgi:hypothetical protein
MGAGVHDVGIALSDWGDHAAGLDIVPRRMEEVLDPVPDAPIPWVLDEATVRAAAGDTPLLRPRFEPGDAVLFDEMLLHATGAGEGLTQQRYSIDSWFFPASRYAYPEFVPMVF